MTLIAPPDPVLPSRATAVKLDAVVLRGLRERNLEGAVQSAGLLHVVGI
ncbi:MAG: hypothetical protein ACRD2F_05780 [Terriglobales bacterium]